MAESARGGRRHRGRRGMAEDPAALRVPPLPRLHRARRPARDEGEHRGRGGPPRPQRRHQARAGRHPRDRVPRAVPAVDPRRARVDPVRTRPAGFAACADGGRTRRPGGGRGAGAGLSLPAPSGKPRADAARRTDPRAAAGRGRPPASGCGSGICRLARVDAGAGCASRPRVGRIRRAAGAAPAPPGARHAGRRLARAVRRRRRGASAGRRRFRRCRRRRSRAARLRPLVRRARAVRSGARAAGPGDAGPARRGGPFGAPGQGAGPHARSAAGHPAPHQLSGPARRTACRAGAPGRRARAQCAVGRTSGPAPAAAGRIARHPRRRAAARPRTPACRHCRRRAGRGCRGRAAHAQRNADGAEFPHRAGHAGPSPVRRRQRPATGLAGRRRAARDAAAGRRRHGRCARPRAGRAVCRRRLRQPRRRRAGFWLGSGSGVLVRRAAGRAADVRRRASVGGLALVPAVGAETGGVAGHAHRRRTPVRRGHASASGRRQGAAGVLAGRLCRLPAPARMDLGASGTGARARHGRRCIVAGRFRGHPPRHADPAACARGRA